MVRRSLGLALIVAVLVGVHLGRTVPAPAPSSVALESTTPPAPVPSAEVPSAGVATPVNVAIDADPDLATSARLAKVKQAISKTIARADRERYVADLTAAGLAPEDAEQTVQEFFDALADCQFETARWQYEAAGVDFEEFLRGAEIVWSRTMLGSTHASVAGVAANAWECANEAGRRAGLALPRPPGVVNFPGAPTSLLPARAEPSILSALGIRAPPIVSSPAADEEEAAILRHIATFPAAALTNLQVQCQIEACIVLMQANSTIDVFRFEFDRFAQANGFQSATIQTFSSARTVILRR